MEEGKKKPIEKGGLIELEFTREHRFPDVK